MGNTTLSQKAIGAIRWTTVNTFFQVGLQFLTLIILGRVLSPVAFGLMGMIMVVVELVNVFARMGMAEAIIHRKEVTRSELSSIYILNVIVGLSLFLFVYLSSSAIGSWYSEQSIVPLVQIMSSTFFISSFGTLFETLLRKNLLFDKLAIINIVSQISAFFLTIILAVKGLEVYALVFGQFFLYTLRTMMFLLLAIKKKWLPQKLRIRFGEIHFYLKFGVYRVLAMSANQFNSRIDQILIGGMLGSATLGYYNVAYRIIYLPIQYLNPILTQVAFPLFSEIQDDSIKLKDSFLRYIGLVVSINVPFLIGLVATSDVLIPLFLGKQWNPSIPIIQALSLYVFIRSIFNAGGSLIVAKGKANWTFYWNVAMLLIIPVAAYLTLILTRSVISVCLCMGIVFFMLFFFHYLVFLRPILSPFFLDYLCVILRPLFPALVMGIVLYGLATLFGNWEGVILVPVLISIGIFTYIFGCVIFNHEIFHEIENVLPRKLGRYVGRFNHYFVAKRGLQYKR